MTLFETCSAAVNDVTEHIVTQSPGRKGVLLTLRFVAWVVNGGGRNSVVVLPSW